MKKPILTACLYAVAAVTTTITFFIPNGIAAAVLMCVCAAAMDAGVTLHMIRRIRQNKPVLRWSVPMVGLALCATLMAIIQIQDLVMY